MMNTSDNLQEIKIESSRIFGNAGRGRRSRVLLLTLVLIIVGAARQAPGSPTIQEASNKSATGQTKDAQGATKRGPQKIVQEGVAVEFTIEPASPRAAK